MVLRFLERGEDRILLLFGQGGERTTGMNLRRGVESRVQPGKRGASPVQLPVRRVDIV